MIENALRKTSGNCLNLVMNEESLQLHTYLCPSGILTIGYGHTGPDVHPGMTITKQEAITLLVKDIGKAENIVKAFVTVPLTQGQFDSLVDLAFNIGIGNFKDSTLVSQLNKGLYNSVPAQLRRWVRGSKIDPKTKQKEILPGLVIRREKDVEMWNG